MSTSKQKQEYTHRAGDPPYRLTRTRRRSPAEVTRDQAVREAVLHEFPPAPGSPAALAVRLRLLRQQLKQARESAGLSLAQLAKRSGIDKAALSRLENGHVPNSGIETILRYVSALGKDIEWRLVDLAEKRGNEVHGQPRR